MKHNKKASEGKAERCAVIEKVWPGEVGRL